MSMLFAAFWIILRNGHLILELVSRWRKPQTSIAEIFAEIFAEMLKYRA